MLIWWLLAGFRFWWVVLLWVCFGGFRFGFGFALGVLCGRWVLWVVLLVLAIVLYIAGWNFDGLWGA